MIVNLKIKKISCFIPTLESIYPTGSKSDHMRAKDPLVKKLNFQHLMAMFRSIKTSIFDCQLENQKDFCFEPTPEYTDLTGSKSDHRGAKDPLVKKFTFQHLMTIFRL